VERLLAFLATSVFAGSMARQKTWRNRAPIAHPRDGSHRRIFLSDAIYSTRPDGTITSWNRAAELLYGYTAEEAVGSPIARTGASRTPGRNGTQPRTAQPRRNVAPYRTERMRKDGTRCPVLLSVSPLRNARGEIVGACAIARDISAEKQSEEAIRRSEKLATAGRLAASIAHEINNPLEAVVNLLYLARHDSRHAGEYLTQAEQEVGRVARLAQQTLGFVRDTSSPGCHGSCRHHGRDSATVFAQTRGPADPRDATLPGDRCEVSGYSGELRQLLANLLVNAVEAMADWRFSARPRGCGTRLVRW
jgi:PAS domain S-box-containing protein